MGVEGWEEGGEGPKGAAPKVAGPKGAGQEGGRAKISRFSPPATIFILSFLSWGCTFGWALGLSCGTTIGRRTPDVEPHLVFRAAINPGMFSRNSPQC